MRLRLLCNKLSLHSSLNLVSRQLKLCDIFIFGIEYFLYQLSLRCVLSQSRLPVLPLSQQVFASVNILQSFYLDLSNYNLFVVVGDRLM